ncbi:MAG: DUF2232 domain-containing protein [Erysipelotrichaceae bacterium]
MKKQVRTITEGSVMLGIIGVLLFLNLQFGLLFQSFFVFIFPIPIIIYTLRYGLKNSIVLFFSAIIMTLMLGQFTTLFYVITGLILGLVYGYGVLKNKSNDVIIAYSIFINALSVFLEIYVFAKVFGYDLASELNLLMTEVSKIPEFSIVSNFESIVLALIPLYIIFVTVLQTLIVHSISIILLRRLGISYRKARPLHTLRLPIWAGIPLMFSLFSGPYLLKNDSVLFQAIGINLNIIAQVVLLFYGFCLIIFFSKRVNKKQIVTYAILSFLFLPNIIIYAFIGLGLLDCFTDIRKRIELITI